MTHTEIHQPQLQINKKTFKLSLAEGQEQTKDIIWLYRRPLGLRINQTVIISKIKSKLKPAKEGRLFEE